METVQFKTRIKNGVIEVPKKYQQEKKPMPETKGCFIITKIRHVSFEKGNLR